MPGKWIARGPVSIKGGGDVRPGDTFDADARDIVGPYEEAPKEDPDARRRSDEARVARAKADKAKRDAGDNS